MKKREKLKLFNEIKQHTDEIISNNNEYYVSIPSYFVNPYDPSSPIPMEKQTCSSTFESYTDSNGQIKLRQKNDNCKEDGGKDTTAVITHTGMTPGSMH